MEEIEHRAKSITDPVPDLILISYRDNLGKWIVRETYKVGKEKYRTEEKLFSTMKEYSIPESFTGVCIVDNVGRSEEVDNPTEVLAKNNPSNQYRLVDYDYCE